MTGLTDAERDEARSLWALGWSARKVADAISREAGRLVTRNAIIGYSFRGKWPRRGADLVSAKEPAVKTMTPAPPREKRQGARRATGTSVETAEPVADVKRARAPRKRVVRPPRPKAPPEPEISMEYDTSVPGAIITFSPPPGSPKSVFELRASECRFPIGDPKSPGFRFCGAAKAFDGPYCPTHKKAAFEPLTATKLRSHT